MRAQTRAKTQIVKQRRNKISERAHGLRSAHWYARAALSESARRARTVSTLSDWATSDRLIWSAAILCPVVLCN